METPLTRNISPGKEPPDLVQYEKTGGYAALRKALTHVARGSSGSGEGIKPARPRWGGVSNRAEVEFRADGRRCAAPEVSCLQCRRDGAGHIQGSPAA